MDELYLDTLGNLCLRPEKGASDCLIGPSKSLAVLAYLTATPGREASRDHIARLLWPGFDSARARRSLRQALYYLSRQAERSLIDTSEGDLSVVEKNFEVDLWTFERALQKADFERAVDLYGGPFLDGFSVEGAREFEGWVETRNERIWSGLKAAYHEVVTNALDEGDPSKAVRYAREYVDLNPFDESARAVLIEAHLAQGDRVAAYRAYEEFRRLLDEELGGEPSESLREQVEGLEEAIFGWSEQAQIVDRRSSDPAAGLDSAQDRAPGSGDRPQPRRVRRESESNGHRHRGQDPDGEDADAGAGGQDPYEPASPGRGQRDAVGQLLSLGRRTGWALAGGMVAALAITVVAATGWLPFEGVADATSAWEGANGTVQVVVRTESGPARASVSIENGEARVVRSDVGRRDAVSPDGVWRAVQVSNSGGPDLRVVDAGSGRLGAQVATPADEKPLTWSPDGRRLLFQAGWLDDESGQYRRRLRVLDRETGEVAELPVSLPAPENGVDEASWSPSGMRIALAFESEDGDQDVFVMRADGTGLRAVSRYAGWDGHPSWSPDGRWLVFASRRGQSADLYMTAADGGEPTRLTSGPEDEVHPRWLTRRHLVYVRRSSGTEHPGTLRLVDVETRRTRVLLERRRLERVYRGRAPGGDPGVQVERISIRAPDGPLSPGLRTELRAVAVTDEGDTLAPSRVPTRWSVADTAVARVEPEGGEIAVRETGTVRVYVSAGGWRSDTVTLRSGPVRTRTAQVLLSEDWSGGIDPTRWRVIGDPEPYVTEVEAVDQAWAEGGGGRGVAGGESGSPAGTGLLGVSSEDPGALRVRGTIVTDGPSPGAGPETSPARAFVNNGDENYDSGVISRRPLSMDGAVTVEFQARTPFTRELFQGLKVALFREDRGPTAGGRLGPGRFANVVLGPRAEGPKLQVGDRSVVLRPVEERDRWHRYALQLHDDGRVSLVVDGALRWRSAVPLLDERPERARLYVGGRSLGTEIQVGPLHVWRGLRYTAGDG